MVLQGAFSEQGWNQSEEFRHVGRPSGGQKWLVLPVTTSRFAGEGPKHSVSTGTLHKFDFGKTMFLARAAFQPLGFGCWFFTSSKNFQ
jgi:hypothetical protein